jgi:Ca2+-binding EF-hand superfamily protein
MKRDKPLVSSCFDSGKTFCILALIATLGFGACQSNQIQPPEQSAAKTGKARFDEVDTNHDGKLSRDEASDYLVNEIFESRDANHDGRMSEKEWVDGDPGRAAGFKERDANHDGVVTKAEAISYGRKYGIANKIMKEADKDGDGQLTFAEVKAYYASREGPPR